MNDSSPRNQHRITIDDGWTIEVPGTNGVERRTLVKGAAWSVPIIATAGATPAFAASPQPTLAFTKSSYSGTGCGTITGVQVKRTVDGTAPDPGKTISVTLADGYTFADGTTTYSGTTDANGLITLPDIKVPAKGGNSNFKASSDSLAATAPVSSTAAAGKAFQVTSSNYTVTSSGVPDGSTPLAYNAYLSPNGQVWINGANRSGTHVVSKAAATGDQGQTSVSWTDSDGKAYQVSSTNYTVGSSNVPDNSTPLAYNAYLTQSGEVWINGAKRSGTHVVSKAAATGDNGNTSVSWTDSDGKAYQVSSTNGYTVASSGVPDNSTPLGYNAYLTQNGQVWINGANRSDTTTTKHVVSKAAATGDQGQTSVSWTDSDGKAYQVSSTNGYTVASSNVPDNSTPLGYNAYLTQSGEVWINGAKRSGTHVVSKAAATGDNGQTSVSWVDEPTCS
ncbi:hypothetical protein E2R33_08110 [Rathayibacter toxicus]|uniref:hypothetical protein n=1 Tax=Rathayibacter toxicus TaxID=145458 RepID=UPI001C05E647|nr:hypothetical protein [Rathayibacter toxicus]QWL28562.1 hypothetical protein E2R33_08110 [Rathayibacter toxicus]